MKVAAAGGGEVGGGARGWPLARGEPPSFRRPYGRVGRQTPGSDGEVGKRPSQTAFENDHVPFKSPEPGLRCMGTRRFV
jgi:hypothetical protein